MSHEIKERDSQWGTEMAWHGLTHVVPEVKREEVFPWKVKLAPVNFEVSEPQFDTSVTPPAPLADKIVQVRHAKNVLPLATDDNQPLGNGSVVNLETYTIQTPDEVWNMRDRIVDGVPNTVVSAGSVFNRGRFFISTKLNDLARLKLSDGSEVDIFLNAIGSLDKSLTEQYSLSSTRIVCNNTLMVSFLTDKIKWRFRHSKNMKTELEQDADLLANATEAASLVGDAFNSLLNNQCSVDRARNIYTGLIVSDGQDEISKRAENMIDQHIECFARGQGNVGQTEFDLLNGWTQLKTKGYDDTKKGRWDTFETSEFGAYANQKVRLAVMLLRNRNDLAKIEQRGYNLQTPHAAPQVIQ